MGTVPINFVFGSLTDEAEENPRCPSGGFKDALQEDILQ